MKTTDLDRQLDDILKKFEEEIEGTQQSNEASKAPAAQKEASFDEVDALVSEMLGGLNAATEKPFQSNIAKMEAPDSMTFTSHTAEIQDLAVKLVEQQAKSIQSPKNNLPVDIRYMKFVDALIHFSQGLDKGIYDERNHELILKSLKELQAYRNEIQFDEVADILDRMETSVRSFIERFKGRDKSARDTLSEIVKHASKERMDEILAKIRENPKALTVIGDLSRGTILHEILDHIKLDPSKRELLLPVIKQIVEINPEVLKCGQAINPRTGEMVGKKPEELNVVRAHPDLKEALTPISPATARVTALLNKHERKEIPVSKSEIDEISKSWGVRKNIVKHLKGAIKLGNETLNDIAFAVTSKYDENSLTPEYSKKAFVFLHALAEGVLATEGVQKAMDELGPLKNSKGEDITADSIIKAAKLHSKTAKHDIEITRN